MRTSVDKTYRCLAAKYIRKQAKQLADQLEGVRAGEDVEFVHRSRVATRRLRAAMRMFSACFRPRQFKKWRKQIHRVTTELGDARDKDVQIEFLRQALDGPIAPECRPGIMRLLVKWEKDRERLQPRVLKALDRLQASRVLRQIQKVTKRVLARTKDEVLSAPSPFTLAQAEGHVRRRLHDLLAYQESLADPQDKARHHAMRIAAKRLRYTLEICRPVYGVRLEETIDAVKRVQTLLGEIHDCDVWAEEFQAFAAKERKRTLKQFGHAGPFAPLEIGIGCLQEDRRQRRERVFQELAAYWQELERQRQWEALATMVESRGWQPIESRCDGPVGAAVGPPSAGARATASEDGGGQPRLSDVAAEGRPEESKEMVALHQRQEAIVQ